MGVLLSRLRAKPSTKELLEDLEKEIEALEEYKRSTEQQHKRVVGSLIFYFILFFIIGAGIFLLYYYPALTTTKEKLIYSIPLWAVPFMFIVLKKFLHWYFMQKIKYNEESLSQMKRRRRSLLEYAMETETYKVVKELLEKFDPEYHKKIFESTPAIEAPPAPQIPVKGNFGDIDLRKRTPPTKVMPSPVIASGQTVTFNNAAGSALIFPHFPTKSPTNPPFPPPYLQRNSQPFARPPMQAMPRPVLPRERSLVDRIVDYLVGDGPSNRYALICRQCQSHNGMALKEEFEFVAFRCCYCFHWNPPRNTQQPPPRLPLPAPSSSPTVVEPLSQSEKSSSSGEATEVEDLHEDQESGNVEDATAFKKSQGSPSLRRRNLSTSEEINAVLEEDRTNVKSHSTTNSFSD